MIKTPWESEFGGTRIVDSSDTSELECISLLREPVGLVALDCTRTRQLLGNALRQPRQSYKEGLVSAHQHGKNGS